MAAVINPILSNVVGIADDGFVLEFRLSDAGGAKTDIKAVKLSWCHSADCVNDKHKHWSGVSGGFALNAAPNDDLGRRVF